MHTNELEEVCMRQGLPVHRPTEGGIEILATGKYPTWSHWVRLTSRQNGLISAYIEFSPCRVCEIENLPELCSIMDRLVFGNLATILFDNTRAHFYVYGLVEKEKLASYLVEFARCCDFAKPLCESIGKHGTWTEEVFELLKSPQELNFYPQ